MNRGVFSWSTLPPTFRRKMRNVEILCQESAAQGNATAQFNLGVLYTNGHGVPQDHVRAVEWYRKAANQEHARAHFCLGLMYNHGHGVTKDGRLAVKFIRKAAKQGDKCAQDFLDSM